MLWNFANSDNTLRLALDASGEGGLVSGTINYLGVDYSVSGGWSGSLPEPSEFSVFSVSGLSPQQPKAPLWIAVSGALRPYSMPGSCKIQVDVISSFDGNFHHFDGDLHPA